MPENLLFDIFLCVWEIIKIEKVFLSPHSFFLCKIMFNQSDCSLEHSSSMNLFVPHSLNIIFIYVFLYV